LTRMTLNRRMWCSSFVWGSNPKETSSKIQCTSGRALTSSLKISKPTSIYRK
jgi:hypothetical protein